MNRTLLACVFAGALASGCSLPAEDVPTIQPAVGTVVGNDAEVALVASGGRLAFYVCGGPTSVAGWTHWFSGSIPGSGEFSLVDSGWTLTGAASPSGGAGQLTPPGGPMRAWSAFPSSAGTTAGLYSVVDEGGCRTGVVVAQPSSSAAITVQGAWCDGTGRFEQVTPILPVVLTDRGIEIQVELAAGPRRLFATLLTVP